MSIADFIIYTDGASRGNPGPAAAAFIFLENEKIIFEQNFYLGVQTNNQAEYQAIIKALEKIVEYTHGKITIFSDSELVVKQLNGEYRVNKPHLRELFNEVDELKKQFTRVNFLYVPRSNQWIKLADQLCNKILDNH
jgi:ribonuclease HI